MLLPIFPIDEIYGQTKMPIAPRSSNSMQIGLCISRKIEVDYNIHCLYIDPPGKKIRTD